MANLPNEQHGFCRDMAFTLKSRTDDMLLFELSSNEETLEKYPFHFTFEIGYILNENHFNSYMEGKKYRQRYNVFFHRCTSRLYMSALPDDKQSDYFLDFHTTGNLTTSRIGEGGLVALL